MRIYQKIKQNKTEAFIAGKNAFALGLSFEACPHVKDTKVYDEWISGWFEADRIENREYIGLGSSNY